MSFPTFLESYGFTIHSEIQKGGVAQYALLVKRTKTEILFCKGFEIEEEEQYQDLEERTNFLNQISYQPHKNIVSFKGEIHDYRFWAFFFDYVKGPTLNSWSKKAKLSLPLIESLFQQLLEANIHLNSLGFYHTDLHSNNIIMKDGKIPVIIDMDSIRPFTEILDGLPETRDTFTIALIIVELIIGRPIDTEDATAANVKMIAKHFQLPKNLSRALVMSFASKFFNSFAILKALEVN